MAAAWRKTLPEWALAALPYVVPSICASTSCNQSGRADFREPGNSQQSTPSWNISSELAFWAEKRNSPKAMPIHFAIRKTRIGALSVYRMEVTTLAIQNCDGCDSDALAFGDAAAGHEQAMHFDRFIGGGHYGGQFTLRGPAEGPLNHYQVDRR